MVLTTVFINFILVLKTSCKRSDLQCKVLIIFGLLDIYNQSYYIQTHVHPQTTVEKSCHGPWYFYFRNQMGLITLHGYTPTVKQGLSVFLYMVTQFPLYKSLNDQSISLEIVSVADATSWLCNIFSSFSMVNITSVLLGTAK